jgi:hypothetical protein
MTSVTRQSDVRWQKASDPPPAKHGAVRSELQAFYFLHLRKAVNDNPGNRSPFACAPGTSSSQMKRDIRACHVLDVRNLVVALEEATKDLYFSSLGRSHVPAMQMQGLHTGVKESAPDVFGPRASGLKN